MNDLQVLERFYNECLKFWEREGSANPEAKALEDVEGITTNPFIFKNAPEIDKTIKAQFIASKK